MSSRNKPLVSIITVCFNSQKSIRKTIESVNNQSYENIEHIFIDGKSNDDTISIIKSTSKRIKLLISEKDDGIFDAMNKGYELSNGLIIAFLNSDDSYTDNKVIDRIVDAFRENSIGCAYGNVLFHKNNKITRVYKTGEYVKGRFLRSWTPPHPTFFFNKNIISEEDLPLYDKSLRLTADFELMFKILELKNIKYKYINEFLVKMTEGGASTKSIISSYRITKEVKLIFKKHNKPLNITNYLFWKFTKAILQKVIYPFYK